MKLYFGGKGNGQRELAERECGLVPVYCAPDAALTAAALCDLHLTLRAVLEQGGEAKAFAAELIEKNPDAVIVCDEIGLGIVPLDAFDRRWREETGRALCLLAAASERVVRVYCGIPQVLK